MDTADPSNGIGVDTEQLQRPKCQASRSIHARLGIVGQRSPRGAAHRPSPDRGAGSWRRSEPTTSNTVYAPPTGIPSGCTMPPGIRIGAWRRVETAESDERKLTS